MRRNKYMSFPIDAVISANLEMQTIQRELYKFGVKNPSLNSLKDNRFINQYNSWTEDKKNTFIKLIGGNANYKKTKTFIEKLINGDNHE